MFRETWVKDRYYHLPVEVRHINDTKCWGVFALEAIPKNTVVEVSPVILYHRDIHDAAAELSDSVLGEGHHIFEDYAFDWTNTGFRAIAMGYGGMYNHSFNANMKSVKQDKPIDAILFVTIKDVNAGEELTHCYTPFPEQLTFVPDDDEEFDWTKTSYGRRETPDETNYHLKVDTGLTTAKARHYLREQERLESLSDGRPRIGDWIKLGNDESS